MPEQRTIALPELDRVFDPPLAQWRLRRSRRNDRIDSGMAYLGFTAGEYDAGFAAAIGNEAGLPDWMEWPRLGGTLELSGGHSYGYTWKIFSREPLALNTPMIASGSEEIFRRFAWNFA